MYYKENEILKLKHIYHHPNYLDNEIDFEENTSSEILEATKEFLEFIGNKSEIHWDLVMIQRPEYGGGTISFDGEVIREDGLFVKDSLLGLNPNNLIGDACTV